MATATLAASLLGAASCSKGGGVPPADVRRFVVVKEATDDMTRLLNLIGTADGTVTQLAKQRPGSAAARHLVAGTRIGWNNVEVGVNAFTPAQANQIPGLTESILATRNMTTAWLNGLDALVRRIQRTSPTSMQGPFAVLGPAVTAEAKAKTLLLHTAATLAATACELETRNPQLAGAGAAAADCTTASRLASPAP